MQQTDVYTCYWYCYHVDCNYYGATNGTVYAQYYYVNTYIYEHGHLQQHE
jgi:hypothetical protein